MKWTDEEVARGVAAAINAGLHDLPVGVVTGIMTATAELLAARGGTMTAEDVGTALVRLQSQGESRSERALREHITAQGARIAALKQHISELEKSLEHARCADEAWFRRMNKAADALADVLPGEVGRLDLLARISELKRQRDEALALAHGSVMDEADHFLADRSKPSGHVAEDVSAIEALWSGVTPPDDDWRKAGESLSRLAAKAQGYEAIRAALAKNYGTDGDPLERVQLLLKSEEHANSEARIEQEERHRVELERDREATRAEKAEQERDAAVADNAALLDLFNEVSNAPRPRSEPTCAWCGTRDHHPICPVGRALANPHPGAALLERIGTMERELEQVRKGELCPHEMPLQRISEEVAKQGETLSAHDVADRAMERMKRLEEALNALRSLRTYARSLTDSDATRVIGQDLLATLARYRVPDLLDGH